MPQGAVSNGKHIDAFIPPDLRDMFYRHPTRPYAWNNGLDPYGFLTEGLSLYLPLWALKDSAFKSVDANRYTATVTGALWQPDGRLFDGDDLINIGAQFNSVSTLWISIWFKFTATFDTNEDAVQFPFGKIVDGSNFFDARFDNIDGKLKFRSTVSGTIFAIETVETSWAAGVWQHVLFSVSAANGVRMIVNKGTAVTNVDTSAILSGGDFVFGGRTDPTSNIGFEGTIHSIMVGTNDLTTAEEDYLYDQQIAFVAG